MTVVRSLAVNGNFSIHYSAGLHVVCHGTVARQYQRLVSLTLSICSFKENTRTVSCANQYFFYVISSQVSSFTVSKCSSHHLFVPIPLLSKSLLQPGDTHSEKAQKRSDWLKQRNRTLNGRGALNFHFKNFAIRCELF